ncbi:unnamed protein product [Alopecurus aequalis]
MANEWQELAMTVRDTLQEACTSVEALRLIDLATTKLQALAEVLRAVRLGAPHAAAADGYVDPAPVGVDPATLLEDARRDINHRSTLQCQAITVLLLCYERMNLDPSTETVESCDIHSSVALGNATDALLRLRDAASFAKAAIDALDMAGQSPADSPLRRAWLTAAEQMEDTAINEVTQARNRVTTMGEALSLQLLDSLNILGLA